MTESEWMASESPAEMLEWLANTRVARGARGHRHGDAAGRYDGGPGPRKLRLFAAACCRAAWHLLTDERSRRAVEAAERFADGLATDGELGAAHVGAFAAWEGGGGNAAGAARYCCVADVRHAARQVTRPGLTDWPPPAAQAALLREIVGDPSRHDYVEEEWLTPQVLTLARAAYEERGPGKCPRCGGLGVANEGGLGPGEEWPDCPDCEDGTGPDGSGHLDPLRLAVLSDALEEAGCPAEVQGYWRVKSVHLGVETDYGRGILPHPILAHLRRPAVCVWCGNTGKVRSPLKMGGPEHGPEIMHVVEPPKDVGAACICRGECGPHVRGCWALDLVLGKD